MLPYESQWSLLEQSPNPFAVIVMTHLKAQATYRDAQGRLQWKLNLVKMLYHRGHSREDILELFRFIDWLMVLPEDLENGFTESLRQYEEDLKMPYVTSIERKGIQQGIQEGMLQQTRDAIFDNLEVRFGDVPGSIVVMVKGVSELAVLKVLHRKSVAVQSLEEFKVSLLKVQD